MTTSFQRIKNFFKFKDTLSVVQWIFIFVGLDLAELIFIHILKEPSIFFGLQDISFTALPLLSFLLLPISYNIIHNKKKVSMKSAIIIPIIMELIWTVLFLNRGLLLITNDSHDVFFLASVVVGLVLAPLILFYITKDNISKIKIKRSQVSRFGGIIVAQNFVFYVAVLNVAPHIENSSVVPIFLIISNIFFICVQVYYIIKWSKDYKNENFPSIQK